MKIDPDRPVAVIGAGPYGLAVAAYLRAAHVPSRSFGEALGYWRTHMPAGMLLRSSWRASAIASPKDRLSLAAYERDQGAAVPRPVPLDDFIRYGQWYQRAAVPDLDSRRVIQVARTHEGFSLTLSDDSQVAASRVILATGLAEFSRRPIPLSSLPPTVVSHTSDHMSMDRFAGQRVVLIGGGQSAIESAVLAHEAGAQVRVIARAADVHWLTRRARIQTLSMLGRMAYAPSDVGPAGLSWVVAAPGMMRRVPARLRGGMARRCLIPAAAAWLQPRAGGITMALGRSVTSAVHTTVGARLTLDNGEVVEADHVMLGTGFAPDIAAVSILAPELREAVQRRGGYPVLRGGFETSVPGLHAVGALATGSFGPLMRFVSGTWYSAPALARTLARASHVSRSKRSAESIGFTTSPENAVERAA